MKSKIFNGKKIMIRELSKNDLGNPKKFQDFINSFIEEDAKILANKKISLREETNWLKDSFKKIEGNKRVYLMAEYNGEIVGSTDVELSRGRRNHIGIFGITIKNGWRGIGLGTYLGEEIIKMAKIKLKPRLKIIQLGVFPNNKPAIKLYKSLGFKKVAVIPKQLQCKGKLISEIIMMKCL